MISQGRQDLVTRILEHGVQVDGERINAAGSSVHLLCDRLEQAGVQPGNIVVLRGLQGRDLVVATMATWQLDAVPLPVLFQEPSVNPRRA